MGKITAEQRGLFEDEPDPRSGSFADFCKRLGVEEGPNWADRFGDALRTWAKDAVRLPVRTLSLFSGVGGLDVAFHDAGFQIQRAVEIEERFVATLKANAESLFRKAQAEACGYGKIGVCRRRLQPAAAFRNRL